MNRKILEDDIKILKELEVTIRELRQDKEAKVRKIIATEIRAE